MVKKVKVKFIVVEGIDFSGKTTVCRKMADTLRPLGFKVYYSQVKKTSTGRVVNKIGKRNFVPTLMKDLLFLGSYLLGAQQSKKKINKGYFVIQDRYYPSLMTYYQVLGPLRNKTRVSILPLIRKMNNFFPEPDLILYVQSPFEDRVERFKRINKKGINDSLLYSKEEEALSLNYEKELRRNLKNFKNVLIIDNSGSLSSLEEAVSDMTNSILAKNYE